MYAAFDIGNVLTEVDFEDFNRTFNDLTYRGLIESSFTAKELVEDIAHLMDCGIGLVEVIKMYCDLHSEERNYVESLLLESWNTAITYNEETLEFIRKLQAEGVKVALLSNMGREHHELFWTECHDLFETCDLHLSFQVGARKPSKLFYQSFLIDHPEYRGGVYVDDLLANLETGKKYGFKTIHFELDKSLNADTLKQDLGKIRSEIYKQELNG